MIIDEDILKDGIDEVLLAKLIGKHSLEQERYEKLYNYYIGKHAICERRRSSDNIANNKIVCNHAKYIVDIAKSYLVGNPVPYSGISPTPAPYTINVLLGGKHTLFGCDCSSA